MDGNGATEGHRGESVSVCLIPFNCVHNKESVSYESQCISIS
jgi:hypothetical protein